ncbi:MAG: esterase-like activity of phytase family protein [Pseudomonadota bacterium]
MRLAIAFGLVLLLIPTFHQAYAKKIVITATPITAFQPGNPDQTKFGSLTFLGGLILESSNENFGGFSGIRIIEESGKIKAITDKARFLTGNIIRQKGNISGIENARLTRVKAADGRTITGAIDKDAEALELFGDRIVLGYERNDRVVTFREKDHKLFVDPKAKVHDFTGLDFPKNKGPEAVAYDRNNAQLLVITEYTLNDAGNHRAFLIGKDNLPQELSVQNHDSYSITDAAFLPNGDLLILERYYSFFSGVYMRLRRILGKDIKPGNTLDGEVLISVNNNYKIDNMEGLAVSKTDDEGTRLTMISDDNFSKSQQTLILEFLLAN